MHQDFKELLSAFNAGRVKYLIVGGYAVSFHAQPRATKDLDILIGADAENSKAVYAALAKFGAPVEGLSAKDFAQPDNFFRMGTPPVMVDIMPRISGVEFEEAWRRRVDVRIDDDLSVPFISREDLLVAKVSAGRAQDLIDVDALREGDQSQEIEQQQRPVSPATAAQSELGQMQKDAREEWLRQREQKGSPPLEEIRAKGREDWLKLRQQRTQQSSRDPNDRSAEKDQDTKPKDLSGTPDKGLDDDLN
jgi:uncharacterized nucleotidyltransferase DUF6036